MNAIMQCLNNDLIASIKFWETLPIEYYKENSSDCTIGIYQKTFNGKSYKWERSELSAFKDFCRDMNKDIKEYWEWLNS